MMGKWLERIYGSSPAWAQQIGINAFGLYWARRRLGSVYERVWREYAERETWTEDRMRDFVERQFRAQVQRAYKEVPYYREAFRQHGISEEQIVHFTLADVPSLPRLEKAKLRANPEMLLTERAARRPPKSFHSSGTTGTPICVYWDSAVHQHNIGVREARSYRWAGVSYRDSRATLAGRVVVSPYHKRPPFWRYNAWEKQLYLSGYHIVPPNVPDYMAALNRFRPVILEGFPSALYFLARLIAQTGREVHRPRAILTTSEGLEPHVRIVLESVYRSKAYQEYGSVENCSLATECERGSLHVHPDFGYLEILRPDGRPAVPGELGEIVVTGFANVNQIFIRYRIGDVGMWATEPCHCGRSIFPVLSQVLGREEDVVVLPDGREMVRFDFLFKELRGVAEGQVVQEALDRLVINIVPTPSYTPADSEAIRLRVSARFGLGPEVNVIIRELDSIPREPNGKFRAVISRVRREAASLSPATSSG
jgi:phenylacetate-CoA ligase